MSDETKAASGGEVTAEDWAPYLCPVCQGRGNLPAGFYGVMSSSTSPEQCRACHGAGVIIVAASLAAKEAECAAVSGDLGQARSFLKDKTQQVADLQNDLYAAHVISQSAQSENQSLRQRVEELSKGLREVQDFIWNLPQESACAAYAVADRLLERTPYHITAVLSATELEKGLPDVLGHPATPSWCAAVDAHHAAIDAYAKEAQAENQSLRQRVEKLRGFERVVEDLHCQIDESWPNLKAASGAIQDKIREVESAFAAAQADSRRLREALTMINERLTEALERGRKGDTEGFPQPINYICEAANLARAAQLASPSATVAAGKAEA